MPFMKKVVSSSKEATLNQDPSLKEVPSSQASVDEVGGLDSNPPEHNMTIIR